MTYRGRFIPKNYQKYAGNATNIVYRSLWERQLFRWLDENSQVIKWSSEEVVIPYICKTDGKIHRYFVDVKATFENGQTHLIEVKPKKETAPPEVQARKTKRYITEVMTYAKNVSKWKAAEEYAKDRGWKFSIWTEETLRGLGIKIL